MRPAFCAIVAFGVAPVTLATQPTPSPEDAQREILIKGANVFRKEHKMPMLAVDEKLAKVAQQHCENMARQNKYGDTDRNGHILDGKDHRARLTDAQYPHEYTHENVGASDDKNAAALVVAAWKKSPGHRDAMLLKGATKIGVGAARSKSGKWYFCQLFAGDGPNYRIRFKNDTKDTITVVLDGFTLQIEPMSGRTLDSFRKGETPSAEVMHRKPEKGKSVVKIEDGFECIITDKDGKGKYAVEAVKRKE